MGEADLGDGLQLFPGVAGAGGVAGGVDNKGLGAGGDGRFQLPGGDLEIRLLIGLDKNRCPAGQHHLIGIGDPVGGRDDDLIPLLDQGLGYVVQAVLGAAGDADLGTAVFDAVVPLHLEDDGVLQVVGASHRHVPGEAGVYGVPGRIPDGVGGVEVRLSGAETDYIDSLSLEGLCFCIYGKRG